MAREVVLPSEVIRVPSKEELSRTVASYISQGFEVVVQDTTSVHLIKRKRFQPKMLLLLLFYVFPFFIYLGYYKYFERDRLVEVRIASAHAIAAYLPPDGGRSQPPEAEAPPGTGAVPPHLSPDGAHWWDGRQWHPVSS